MYFPEINLFAGSVYIEKDPKKSSPNPPCLQGETPNILFQNELFLQSTPGVGKIQSNSEILGKQRFMQIKCLRELYNTPEEIQTLTEKFRSYRRMESENLEIFSNFLLKFDRENRYRPENMENLKNLLDKKNDMYYVLYEKSERLLLKKENITETEFKSIYESIFQNHFEILNSLPNDLRKEIIEIINKL